MLSTPSIPVDRVHFVKQPVTAALKWPKLDPASLAACLLGSVGGPAGEQQDGRVAGHQICIGTNSSVERLILAATETSAALLVLPMYR